MAPRRRRGYRTIKVDLSDGEVVPVHASPRIADALEEIMKDMPLYEGVQMMKVLETVYKQGTKDGARATIEAYDEANREIKATIKHRNPGRPKGS